MAGRFIIPRNTRILIFNGSKSSVDMCTKRYKGKYMVFNNIDEQTLSRMKSNTGVRSYYLYKVSEIDGFKLNDVTLPKLDLYDDFILVKKSH